MEGRILSQILKKLLENSELSENPRVIRLRDTREGPVKSDEEKRILTTEGII